jgi:serine O-acetyltransferase
MNDRGTLFASFMFSLSGENLPIRSATLPGREAKKQSNMEVQEIWSIILGEAKRESEREPEISMFLEQHILRYPEFAPSLAMLLSVKLGSKHFPPQVLQDLFENFYRRHPAAVEYAVEDLVATQQRDPAAVNYFEIMLFLKGYQALQSYRLGHWLWLNDRKSLAYFLQNRISEVFAVDIHPAAVIGKGILIDHATSLVIGETAVVDDNVSLLHEVTLGGTGKETGDRHPKVRSSVMIGAGAKILGNIVIGEGAKVGAGSVVLDDVPAHYTVAGVPAHIVGRTEVPEPALDMNQRLVFPDRKKH